MPCLGCVHLTRRGSVVVQARLLRAEAERDAAAQEKDAALRRLADADALLSAERAKLKAAVEGVQTRMEVVGRGLLAQQEKAQEVWRAVEGLEDAGEEREAQLQVDALISSCRCRSVCGSCNYLICIRQTIGLLMTCRPSC